MGGWSGYCNEGFNFIFGPGCFLQYLRESRLKKRVSYISIGPSNSVFHYRIQQKFSIALCRGLFESKL